MASVGRGQGLPPARHSHFQMPLQWTHHDRAELISQVGASVQTYLKRGRKCQADKGGVEQKE